MAMRTLITTLPPMVSGGVTTKARLMARALADAGHDVTVAYYALASGGDAPASAFGGARSVAVPCTGHWLEQRYTAPSAAWRRLIAEHDRHVAVGGTVLIANPLAAAGRRQMIWCAADLAADRGHRWRAMPTWRQAVDALMVTPALARQQTRVLAADNLIYCVSADTVTRLQEIAPARAKTIRRLPIPVDTDFFTPAEPVPHGGCRIGFAGRLDDPRKNAGLLFAMLADLRSRGVDATLALTGTPSPALSDLAARHDVTAAVSFAGVLDAEALRRFYQSLDVFVIASLQEGLAIAGLEAMACGVPVVSTRCGGPADYVFDGKTGRLTGFEPAELADAVLEVTPPEVRERLAARARRTVELDYTPAMFGRNLADAWRATWGENP